MTLTLTDSTTTNRAVPVVAVRGEVDLNTAGLLQKHLLEAGSGHQLLIAELSGIDFFDSTGLRALDNAREELARTGTTIALVGAPARIVRLMSITGLLDQFALHDRVEDATAGTR